MLYMGYIGNSYNIISYERCYKFEEMVDNKL